MANIRKDTMRKYRDVKEKVRSIGPEKFTQDWPFRVVKLNPPENIYDFRGDGRNVTNKLYGILGPNRLIWKTGDWGDSLVKFAAEWSEAFELGQKSAEKGEKAHA
jgi:hypothetical protein